MLELIRLVDKGLRRHAKGRGDEVKSKPGTVQECCQVVRGSVHVQGPCGIQEDGWGGKGCHCPVGSQLLCHWGTPEGGVPRLQAERSGPLSSVLELPEGSSL